MMRAEAERRAAEMFADLDRDGDGALDPWEAPRGPERMIGAMFDRLDADEDGVVTREEAEAAGERMRERRRDRD
jgi:Ca2+-binding EF-hand superfamily protein